MQSVSIVSSSWKSTLTRSLYHVTYFRKHRYFLSDCACAFFQVATDVYTDLRYNSAEWDNVPTVIGHEVYYRRINTGTRMAAIAFLRNALDIGLKDVVELVDTYPSIIVSTNSYSEEIVLGVYNKLKELDFDVEYREILMDKEEYK